jgi:peptidylprolyl isomerase
LADIGFMKLNRTLAASLIAFACATGAQAKKPPPTPPPPAAPAAPTDADMRTPDPQDLLVIETTKGRILVELNDVAAPQAAARIRTLAHQGVYDGRSFFRVIDDFMDQTGDPLDSGVGQSSLPNITAEFTFKRGADTPVVVADRNGGTEEGFLGSLPVISQTMDLAAMTADHRVQAWGDYCPGVLGVARGDDPDSGNSQFFIERTNSHSPDHSLQALNKKYTAFGRVIAGQDVVDAIAVGEPPAAPDKMISVKVLADMPEATRPKVRIVDAASPWARAQMARLEQELVPDFTVCDVKLPVQVN